MLPLAPQSDFLLHALGALTSNPSPACVTHLACFILLAVMFDNKNSLTEHVSAGADPSGHVEKQRRSGRVKRHCGRFWWLYILLVIVLVLVIVLPM